MCLCQSYEGNIEPQCECQSERRAALTSKHMEITARSGSTCASRMEAGWWMLCEADSQSSAHPQGLLFLGHGSGQAPRELQGSFRLGRMWVWMLSLLDQWKRRTQWTQVQRTALRGQFKWRTEAGAANLCNTAQTH